MSEDKAKLLANSLLFMHVTKTCNVNRLWHSCRTVSFSVACQNHSQILSNLKFLFC